MKRNARRSLEREEAIERRRANAVRENEGGGLEYPIRSGAEDACDRRGGIGAIHRTVKKPVCPNASMRRRVVEGTSRITSPIITF